MQSAPTLSAKRDSSIASAVELAPVPAMIGTRPARLLDGDADDLAVLVDGHRRRLAGRADDGDALRAFADVPVDEAAQRGVVDRAVVLHRRDERDDAAGDGFHAGIPESIDSTEPGRRSRRRRPGRPAGSAPGRAGRLAHRDQALDEALRVAQEAVFVSHDAQTREGGEKFTRAEQEVAPRRPADAFVARGEGLVQQDAAGRERCRERREQRPPEVVGDDDGVEGPAGERPGAGLEVGDDDFGTSGERRASHRRRGRPR